MNAQITVSSAMQGYVLASKKSPGIDHARRTNSPPLHHNCCDDGGHSNTHHTICHLDQIILYWNHQKDKYVHKIKMLDRIRDSRYAGFTLALMFVGAQDRRHLH